MLNIFCRAKISNPSMRILKIAHFSHRNIRQEYNDFCICKRLFGNGNIPTKEIANSRSKLEISRFPNNGITDPNAYRQQQPKTLSPPMNKGIQTSGNFWINRVLRAKKYNFLAPFSARREHGNTCHSKKI
jgi:hypothetical protein